MHLALIHSNQPGNQYVGGSASLDDSEQAWMRKLALGLADELRARGMTVSVGPVGPTYATNVAWAAHQQADRLISLHSNAAGNACILWGSSDASHQLALDLQRELNAAAILPFGDTWELNPRKVSETTKTPPPAALLEVGQHDRLDYADWLRDGITSGTYARALAGPIARALGADPTTPIDTPAPAAPSATPTPAPPPAFPLPAGAYFGPKSGPARSVSGYYSHREELRAWQQRMKDRGWRLDADGLYGPETSRVARSFQSEKGLAADGLIGPATWAAAWVAPITN